MLGKWRNLSMFKKMTTLLLIVSLLPLSIYGGILYYLTARSLEEVYEEFSTVMGSQIINEVDAFINRSNRVTKSMLVDRGLLSRMDDDTLGVTEKSNLRLELRRLFLRTTTLNPEIRAVCVVTAQGNSFAVESDSANLNTAALLEQEWLRKALDSDETLVLTPIHDRGYYDRFQDTAVISTVRKIYGTGGNYEGFLLIDSNASALLNVSDMLLERGDQVIRVCVLNGDNEILFHSGLSSGQLPSHAADPEALLDYQSDPDKYIIVSTATESQGLRADIAVPRAIALARVNRARDAAALLAVVLVSLSIGLSIALSRPISRPVRAVQAGMADLEREVYRPLALNVGNDEIGQLVGSYNHMVDKVRQLINDVYLAEIKQKDAQYLALQTQINPHMLFNTLESIRMKALMSGDDDTARMIKLLARMFRAALDGGGTATVKDELEYAESYLALQNMRVKDRYFLDIDVDPAWLDVDIIPILFQPILENSIEHACRDRSTALHLSIESRALPDGRLQFLIRDDGVGIAPERFAELQRRFAEIERGITLLPGEGDRGGSIGLVNIAERIRLRYGDRGRLELLSSDERGTCIGIIIPIERK